MKTQEAVALKKRLIIALDMMTDGDARNLVVFAEVSALENSRRQTGFYLVRTGSTVGISTISR